MPQEPDDAAAGAEGTQAEPCPFRYVYKGRTFCTAAVRERRFTTSRVSPVTCDECAVPGLVAAHGCASLDVGVEIDEYGPRAEVVFVFTACRATVQELTDLSDCSLDCCALWQPADEARWEQLRTRALRRQQLLEDREGRPR